MHEAGAVNRRGWLAEDLAGTRYGESDKDDEDDKDCNDEYDNDID